MCIIVILKYIGLLGKSSIQNNNNNNITILLWFSMMYTITYILRSTTFIFVIYYKCSYTCMLYTECITLHLYVVGKHNDTSIHYVI